MEENAKTTMTDPDDGVNSYIPAMEVETGSVAPSPNSFTVFGDIIPPSITELPQSELY